VPQHKCKRYSQTWMGSVDIWQPACRHVFRFRGLFHGSTTVNPKFRAITPVPLSRRKCGVSCQGKIRKVEHPEYQVFATLSQSTRLPLSGNLMCVDYAITSIMIEIRHCSANWMSSPTHKNKLNCRKKWIKLNEITINSVNRCRSDYHN